MHPGRDPRGDSGPPAVPGGTIDRPLFIVGPHRSGTTLVYRFLSRHPDVAFFTNLDRRFRASPVLAHLLGSAMAGLGSRPFPHEGQRLWDRFRTGEDDRMDAGDAPPEVAAWFRGRVLRVLSLRGRTRFLAKYPRLSLRLPWLDAVFPGCLFLHVTRDWRATVHSTASWRASREERGGESTWFGVRVPGWRSINGTPVAAAARIFREVTVHLEGERERFGERLRVVRYEDFCARPAEEVRAITAWAGLAWSPEFEARVTRNLSARNDSWREALDPEELERIRAGDPGFFARHEA